MGQRLNLEFQLNGKALANAYYHWSGYTTTAVNLAVKAVGAWDRLGKVLPYPTISSQIIRAMLALKSTLATVSDEEMEPALKCLVSKYMDAIRSGEIALNESKVNESDAALADNFIRKVKPRLESANKNANRNNGLICCSVDGMSETQCAAEATVIVDVGYRTVDIRSAFEEYESDWEYAFSCGYDFDDNGQLMDEDGEIIEFADYPYDLVVAFEDISTVAQYLCDHEGEDFQFDGFVYSYIY